MALTTDRIGLVHEAIHEQARPLVAASTTIYVGGYVSYDANGYAVPAADTAAQANKAVHYALEGADNSTGAAGDKRVLVMTRGIALSPKGALVQADIGKVVHATADDTLALTSTNGRETGRLIAIDGNLAAVQIG